jgi:hypothetical protein
LTPYNKPETIRNESLELIRRESGDIPDCNNQRNSDSEECEKTNENWRIF